MPRRAVVVLLWTLVGAACAGEPPPQREGSPVAPQREGSLVAPQREGSLVAPQRQRSLVHLLKHDCGSCHGMTLRGGLGPPLTAAALDHKSPGALEATILFGRPGTPMPPWQGMLSRAEVRWLVQYLMAGDIR